jgi:hypothetical protein
MIHSRSTRSALSLSRCAPPPSLISFTSVQKRHIGNDELNIIWCETDVDYAITTMRTKVTCLYIIIYPLRRGFARVQLKSTVRSTCHTLFEAQCMADLPAFGHAGYPSCCCNAETGAVLVGTTTRRHDRAPAVSGHTSTLDCDQR